MKINKKSRAIAGLFLGLLFVVTVSNAALAQTPTESITISPVAKRYTFDAGETKRDKLTIVNDGETDYDFIVYARPYYTASTSYEPVFNSDRANADSYKWVQFDRTKFRIKAGEKIDVNYTVRVPDNAAPGGHYGVLFAETQVSTQTEDAVAIGRNRRVGSIIYATVNGDYKVGGSIDSVRTSFFQTGKPLTSNSFVSNSGNTDFLANVRLEVKSIFGKTKFTDTKEYAVLPDTTRDIEMKWSKSPIFGLYKAETSVSALDQKKAASSYVFLAPLWFYGFVLLAIIWVVVYVIVRKRRK